LFLVLHLQIQSGIVVPQNASVQIVKTATIRTRGKAGFVAAVVFSVFTFHMAGAEESGQANTVTTAERGAGWKLLFDGKTTQGWRSYRKKTFPDKGWVVEEGCLKKVANVRGGDIVTEAAFGDFDLSWEWRVAVGGNNGVKYLVTEERPGAPGHEYQMVDDKRHPDAAKGLR